MHPMREHLRQYEDTQKKKREKSKVKTTKEGQDVYNFAGSAGFKILMRDVKEELNDLNLQIFDEKTKAKDIEELRIQGKCWNKILKKLNGYLTKRKVTQIKQKNKDAEEDSI